MCINFVTNLGYYGQFAIFFEVSCKISLIIYESQESGSLPGNLSALVVDGPRASTKPTGKTVEEFTDYCKNLIRQGSEESEDSASKGQTEPSADSTDASSTFKRHPFQIKPRNDTAIVMNIRNAIPVRDNV